MGAMLLLGGILVLVRLGYTLYDDFRTGDPFGEEYTLQAGESREHYFSVDDDDAVLEIFVDSVPDKLPVRLTVQAPRPDETPTINEMQTELQVTFTVVKRGIHSITLTNLSDAAGSFDVDIYDDSTFSNLYYGLGAIALIISGIVILPIGVWQRRKNLKKNQSDKLA